MSVYMTFHRCANVRLSSTFVSNANSVQLTIEHDGGETEITLYDLPREVTDKINVLRDKWTRDVDAIENKAA